MGINVVTRLLTAARAICRNLTARSSACSKVQLTMVVCVSAFVGILIGPTAAHAALGENGLSIARDQEALRGTLNSTPMAGYAVHVIKSGSGASVREYVNAAGTVFALTWNGTQVPDLKLLLSGFYDRYVSAAQAHRGGHHVFTMTTPELVMTVVRFQRKASGQVYLPALMPNGMTRQDLQ